MAHTAGPWTIKEDAGWTSSDGTVDCGGFQIDAPDITQLAYVWRYNRRWGDNAEPFGATEAEANANLTAAAPDLLAALKAMDDAMCGDFDTQAGRMAGRKALIAARVAIAKATATEGGN